MSQGTARTEVLDRIRLALANRPESPAVPRAYQVSLEPEADAVELFADRVRDYRADVRLVDESALPGEIAEVLGAIPAETVVVPDGVPDEWLEGVVANIVYDEAVLGHGQLDAIDAVITTCAVAIADTGTFVLDGGLGQGRRALSLLPDHHICVVRSNQIVGHVSEALTLVDPRRPLTWVSGPSATSDIELQRIEGVHGPRHLVVLIVRS